MKYLLIENLAILVCSIVGILSGLHYLNFRKALYANMIVQGMICVALGRLFQCGLLLTGGSLTERFQLGSLGIMGAFSFFFSANFGQIDSLVDGGERQFTKYRIMALVGPVAVMVALIPILLSSVNQTFKISSAAVSCIIGVACYFHAKHIMIPDVDYGVVRCLRGYNVLAAVLSLLSMLELIALAWNIDILLYGSGVGLCAATLALVPTMDKGVKRWQT